MISLKQMNVPIVERSLRGDIMELQIRKRTGELVPFNKNKIYTAIEKAWHEIYPNETDKPEYAQEIADMVENVAKELEEPMGVEDIQKETFEHTIEIIQKYYSNHISLHFLKIMLNQMEDSYGFY